MRVYVKKKKIQPTIEEKIWQTLYLAKDWCLVHTKNSLDSTVEKDEETFH